MTCLFNATQPQLAPSMPAAVFSEGAHDIEESHPLLLRGTHALAERYLSLPHVVKRIREVSRKCRRSHVLGLCCCASGGAQAVLGAILLLLLLGHAALTHSSAFTQWRVALQANCCLGFVSVPTLPAMLNQAMLLLHACRSGMHGSTGCRRARSSTCTAKQVCV